MTTRIERGPARGSRALPAQTSLSPGKHYHAFLSYKRDPDEPIAAALQRSLQTLARPWLAWRAIRVFRDLTSIPATSDLSAAIRQRLDRSEWMILLASPEAFLRHNPDLPTWVEQELDYWLTRGDGASRLLIGVTGGSVLWDSIAKDFDWQHTTAIPRTWEGRFSTEPAYIDLTWARDPATRETLTLRHPRFADAVAALSEPIRGIDREVLFSEDGHQHRRALRFRNFAITGLAMLLAAAIALATWAMASAAHAELNRRRATTQAALVDVECEQTAHDQQRSELAAWNAHVNQRLADVNSREATLQQQDAERQSTVNVARRLAAQAQAVLFEFPERSALLALEAMRTISGSAVQDLQAEDILRRTWKNLGGSVPMRHKGLTSLAVSPDGRWLATGGQDGSIRLWDLEQSVPVARVLKGHTKQIDVLVFSPDGRWLVSGCEDLSYLQNAPVDGTARLWRVADATAVAVLKGSGEAVEIEFGPRSDLLAILWAEGSASIWPMTANGAGSARELASTQHPAREIAFSPDESWFGMGTREGAALVWPASGLFSAAPATLSGHQDPVVRGLAFSPDGRWLVTTSGADGTTSRIAHLWRLAPDGSAAGKYDLPIRDTFHYVREVRFSADSRWLVMQADHPVLRLWHLPPHGQEPAAAALRGYDLTASQGIAETFTDVAFSDDSRLLGAGTTEGAVFVVDLSGAFLQHLDSVEDVRPSLVRLPGSGGAAVLQIRVSGTGRHLLAGSGDGKVRIWDLQSRSSAPAVLAGHEGMVHALSLTKDDRWLVTASLADGRAGFVGDEAVRRYRFSPQAGPLSPTNIATIPTHGYAPRRSPDVRWIAVHTAYEETTLVDVARPGEPASVRVVPGEMGEPAFSAGSRWLVTKASDRLVLTNLRTVLDPISIRLPGDSQANVAQDATRVAGAVWDRSERWLVVTGRDGSNWLFESTAGAAPALKTRLTAAGWGGPVAFSDDGRWLFVQETVQRGRGGARLFDLRQPSAIRDYRIPMPVVQSGVFFGERIVFSAPDGSAKVWRLPYAESNADALPMRRSADYAADYRNLFATAPGWVVTLSSRDALLWDVTTVPPRRFELGRREPNGWNGYYSAWSNVVFSKGNSWLALVQKSAGEKDTGITLARLNGGQVTTRKLARFDGETTGITRFSPDGRWLAVGGGESLGRFVEHTTIRLWDLAGDAWGKSSRVLKAHEKTVHDFEFSSDGRHLVSTGIDKGIVHWSLSSTNPSRAFAFLQEPMKAAALSSAEIFVEPATNDVIALTETDAEIGEESIVVDRIPLDASRIQQALAEQIGRTLTGDERTRFLTTGPRDGTGIDPSLDPIRAEREVLTTALSGTLVGAMGVSSGDLYADLETRQLIARRPVPPPADDRDLDVRRTGLKARLQAVENESRALRWWNVPAIVRLVRSGATGAK